MEWGIGWKRRGELDSYPKLEMAGVGCVTTGAGELNGCIEDGICVWVRLSGEVVSPARILVCC